ncbi:MAG: TatD family hydrolase [Patescibacteria group bacterium]
MKNQLPKMDIIDSHTHAHFPAYDADREAVIKRAQEAGVKMICVGTQFSTSESAIQLAEKYPADIWATAGFHPNHLSNEWHHDRKEQSEAAPEKFDIEKFRQLARHPKVAAIGECGLDYYRKMPNDVAQMAKQKEVFLEHVKLANEAKKPLMIHCRPSKGTDDAYQDLINSLKEQKPLLHAVAHFYVGSLAMAKQLLESGFYFTFGGVITFARDYDEVVQYIPLDRILLETDAPYVAPAPYRGKRNEPAYIVETAKKLAEIKNISAGKAAEAATANALKVFQISV